MNCHTNYHVKGALVQMENEGTIDVEDEAIKCCVSWVTRQGVEVGIEYPVSAWNSHVQVTNRLPLLFKV